MTIGTRCVATIAASAIAVAGTLLAQSTGAGKPSGGAPPGDGPDAIVAAFHSALEHGDRQAALTLLLPDVSIYEGGEAELSRDAYSAEHLAADIEFTKATTEQIDARESHTAGDAAWVLTRSHTTGTFRGRRVHSASVETMVLRYSKEGWRIAHVHWSSHSVSG